MKFRVKLMEAGTMKSLSLIGSTISKLRKSCVLRIGETKLHFLIYDENSTPKQTTAWCTLNSLTFFNEYQMEGVTDKNEIYLEFPSGIFSASLNLLKQGNVASSVKIKLTEKTTPCLTIDIEMNSETDVARKCIHDVPVRLLPKEEWTEYSDPLEFNFSIGIEILCLKKLKIVIERIKKICHFIEIIGSTEDHFTVQANANNASIKSIFKNTIIVHRTELSKATVRVEAKQLHQLMCCEQLLSKKIICEILDGKLLHFQLLNEHFEFNFFLVAIDE